MHQFKRFKYHQLTIFFCVVYLIFKLYITAVNYIRPEIICQYSTENDQKDAIPSVEDPSFSPGDQPIFFHETSCRGVITNRQACAVESAARLHPKRQINLLFSGPVNGSSLYNSNLVHLLQIENIKIFRIHVEKYAVGTVVESIIRTRLKKSAHPIEHMSDILRMVTLNKFGGVYLDTDSFLVKNLDSLPPNWIAEEENSSIASGAMGFSKDGLGFNLTSAILMEVHDTYLAQPWCINGPKAIERVLNRICPEAIVKTGDCKGLKIFPHQLFYPVHYYYYWQYFKNRYLDTLHKAYMHHMWNFLTRKMKIDRFSPFALIARDFCPTIFKKYGKDFGQ